MVRWLLVLLLVLHGRSWAIGEVAAETGKVYSCQRENGTTAQASSASVAAYQCLGTTRVSYSWGTATYSIGECDENSNPAVCKVIQSISYVGGGGETSVGGTKAVGWSIQSMCPENSAQVDKPGGGTTCSCTTGTKAVGGKCQQYTCPTAGNYTSQTVPDQQVPNAGDTLCSGGCGYVPSSWKVGEDGKIWATWPFKSSGKACGGAPNPDKPGVETGEKNTGKPAPVACAMNLCPGTVNGTATCVPCRKTVDAPSTSSSSASSPDGSASGPGSTSTTTRSTECNGITCVTTTTTRDGNGQVTGTEQEEKKQESFCKDNPESPLCKKSSFNGSCGGPISCDGDAVQCAIAADQVRRNCEWFDDPAAAQLKITGDSAMTGELRGPDHPANTAQASSVDFNSSLDFSDRLGGACPVDVTVTIADHSVAIPFSNMCEPLNMLGQLLVGLTALWCVSIVFRG